MEILLILGFCMIVLCALCGISIYLSAIGFLEKMHFANDYLVIHLFHNRRRYLFILCQPDL